MAFQPQFPVFLGRTLVDGARLLRALIYSLALFASITGWAGESSSHLRPFVDESEVPALLQAIQIQTGFPFEVYRLGCAERAQLISCFLEDRGILSRKLILEASMEAFSQVPVEGDRRYYRTGQKSWEGDNGIWPFHVMATIQVRKASGQIEEFAIDPAVIDGLGSLEDWIQTWPRCRVVEPEKLDPNRKFRSTRPKQCIAYFVDRHTLGPHQAVTDALSPPKSWRKEDMQSIEDFVRDARIKPGWINSPDSAPLYRCRAAQ